jgi:hypothetical protein
MSLKLEWLKSWTGSKKHTHLSSDGGQTTLCGHGRQGSGYPHTPGVSNTPPEQEQCQDCIDIYTRMALAVEKRREEKRIELERMHDE